MYCTTKNTPTVQRSFEDHFHCLHTCQPLDQLSIWLPSAFKILHVWHWTRHYKLEEWDQYRNQMISRITLQRKSNHRSGSDTDIRDLWKHDWQHFQHSCLGNWIPSWHQIVETGQVEPKQLIQGAKRTGFILWASVATDPPLNVTLNTGVLVSHAGSASTWCFSGLKRFAMSNQHLWESVFRVSNIRSLLKNPRQCLPMLDVKMVLTHY